ncbi:heme o synthase [Acidimicrobiia bacterium]|nr:heme o synthase [Acidimicrobiia bacterium]MDA8552551.1 heme o synthase [bacterium]MDB3980748.1 heme o synthase [Acidimicrobiia bacterium]MDC0606686.1 heme o synthase [Acidimicrobiia bacterium]MDC0978381.1 heme o synthase [Acidimicrobiia bacterium]
MLSNKISLVKKYIKLSKLRVVELLLVTTVPSMIVSLYSMPPLNLVAYTLIGGTLLAVSANVMNQVFEIDRDKLMTRTSDRPLVTGDLQKSSAIIYSIAMGVIGFMVLYFLTTPTAALIGLIANQFYIFVYTLILKPRTNQNIVIGGAAGAAPVLIGWTATGSALDVGAWLLFLLVFMWTPAHFWALSIENESDYKNADFPMLPTQETYERSSIYIAIYSCATVLISIAAAPVLQLGIVYLLISISLGTNLMYKSFSLYKKNIQPIKYFVFSNTYLAVIFLGIVADIMWTLRGVVT